MGKTGWIGVLSLLSAFSLSAGAAGPGSGTSNGTNNGPGNAKVANLPDGYQQGRSDAKYGTYSTVIQPSGRDYQERMMILENKAFGLAALAATSDEVTQSESVYLLENEVIRLYVDIADAPESAFSSFERNSLLANTVRTYQQVRHHAERLYENMIRYIDQQIPGPNGQQIRQEEPSRDAVYYPNYRSDLDLTPAERQVEYQKKVDAFLKKGGSWNEIKPLTAKLVRSLGEYTRYEYAWLESGEVMVTEGDAGHILLARGGTVRSAGQIVFVKDHAGKYPMMIVTNASGSYKPDILSAEEMAHSMWTKLGINSDLSIVTKGEPLSTQGVKIYLKGQGAPADQISKRVKALESEGHDIIFPPPIRGEMCASIFSSAS